MFTKKQLIVLSALLTVSTSTYPMFDAVAAWLNQAGTTVNQNRGTAALVGAGVCALGATVYYAWKKLTRRPKRIVSARTPESVSVDPLDYYYPRPDAYNHFKQPLKPGIIAAVYGNAIDFLRDSLRRADFDINDVDEYGNTLLHHALLSDDMREATITFLVTAGIDISRTNNEGYTAYRWAKLQGKLAGKHFPILDVLNPASA